MNDSAAPDNASPLLNSATKAKLNRRWRRFSLSSLAGLVLVASIFFARYGHPYHEMHRSLSRVVIKDDLAFVTDFSGLVH